MKNKKLANVFLMSYGKLNLCWTNTNNAAYNKTGCRNGLPVTEQMTATRRITDFMLVLVDCKQRS
jgi:hypothetical protein